MLKKISPKIISGSILISISLILLLFLHVKQYQKGKSQLKTGRYPFH